MSITKTTGLVLAAVSTCATAVNMTAITNASEAVATLQAGHGVLVGDLLEMTSGWGRLNGRLVRAKTVATNDVTLEGVNTTSTVNYPAGAGTGTVRLANASTGLINMSQIKLCAAMFKIVPNPTFVAEARITVPGADAGLLKIEWRHQCRAALKAWMESTSAKGDGDALHAVIASWSEVVDVLGDPVNYIRSALADLLADLLDAYPTAASELFQAYIDALTESRLGNS